LKRRECDKEWRVQDERERETGRMKKGRMEEEK